MAQILLEIGIIFLAAGALSLIAKGLRQPLILGYLLSGLIIGPAGVGIIKNQETISTISELGIAFILFIVGLELDIRKIKNFGWITLIAGLAQVIITFIASYFILTQFELLKPYAKLLALALTLSSTVIGVKLLTDKREINSLHGRIVLGILLIQDFVAILALTFLSTQFTIATIGISLIKLMMLIIGLLLFSTLLLPHTFKFVALNQELLFVISLTWFFVIAFLADLLGLSIAIGAFLAGVGLAGLPYNLEIEGRIKSLRDFFSIIFFVGFGMQITPTNLESLITPAIILSLSVLILNPIIVMITTSLMGITSRNAFLSGIHIAQISEFSLVLVVLAQKTGAPKELASLIALIALITFTTSTYMITYANKIYKIIKPVIKPLELIGAISKTPQFMPKNFYPEILLCGVDKTGTKILNFLEKNNKKILTIDFNPEVVEHMKTKEIPAIYGDITDHELLNKIKTENLKIVISTVESHKDNTFLIKHFKKNNRKTIIITTAIQIQEALDQYSHGSDYVMVPHLLSGEYVSMILSKNINNLQKIKEQKKQHIKELTKHLLHRRKV